MANEKRVLSHGTVFLFVCLLAVTNASNARESESLEAFSVTCDFQQANSPVVSASFAPIRPRNVDETNEDGSWGYVFENNERKYPNDQYKLPADGGQIHFISTLDAKDSASLPKFIWHVISVPTVQAREESKRLMGFIARHRELQEEHGVWSRDEYMTLYKSKTGSQDNVLLTFVDRTLTNDDRRGIREAWASTVQETILKNLILPSGSSSSLYTHTFVYQEVPTDAMLVRTGGDRRNSSKIVGAAGQAYGFVLDDQGTCLASATLQLVP